MAEVSNATEVIDLNAETAAKPTKRALAYVEVGPVLRMTETERVYLSRSRKQIASAEAGKPPAAFLTFEGNGGTLQQSIPYRAVGFALTHDVVPMSQVVVRWTKSGRLADVLASLADVLTSDDAEVSAAVSMLSARERELLADVLLAEPETEPEDEPETEPVGADEL